MILKQSNFNGKDMFKQWKREGYQKKLKWRLTGRIKRGRSKLFWAEGIRGLMGEKELVEEDCWRRKII
jgi:hypothetical protein